MMTAVMAAAAVPAGAAGHFAAFPVAAIDALADDVRHGLAADRGLHDGTFDDAPHVHAHALGNVADFRHALPRRAGSRPRLGPAFPLVRGVRFLAVLDLVRLTTRGITTVARARGDGGCRRHGAREGNEAKTLPNHAFSFCFVRVFVPPLPDARNGRSEKPLKEDLLELCAMLGGWRSKPAWELCKKGFKSSG
jgi:hypothetical protein